MRLLKIAAWAVFAADALITLVWFGAGVASTDRADPSLLFALVAAVPLCGLFALVFFGARRDGWVRLLLAFVRAAVFRDRDDRRAARLMAADVTVGADPACLPRYRPGRGCAIVAATPFGRIRNG
jgi:hypothetical protein